jgi:hypothetical protein
MSSRLVETLLLQTGHVIRNQQLHLVRLEDACRKNGFFLT